MSTNCWSALNSQHIKIALFRNGNRLSRAGRGLWLARKERAEPKVVLLFLGVGRLHTVQLRFSFRKLTVCDDLCVM